MTLTITLIGGPTALIEIDGFRLLTDPTFDQPGAYQLPHVKLEKLSGPAMSARDGRYAARCLAELMTHIRTCCACCLKMQHRDYEL